MAITDFFDSEDENAETAENSSPTPDKKTKPHVIRRNIEAFLEKKELEKRLHDVFEDDPTADLDW